MRFSDLYLVPANWLLAHAIPILAAIVVLGLGWFLSRFAAQALTNLLPRTGGVDKTFAPLLTQVIHYGILLLALVTALNLVGVESTSILAVLGAAGIAIALALQGTLANIAAGLMLVWQRPIAVGEYITGDGVAGVVVEIGLFGTRLRTTGGLYVFTPNKKLWSSAITNHSREPNRRIELTVTVPDTINVAQARRILLNVAGRDSRVLADPAPAVHVDTFSGSTVGMQLRCWVATLDYLPTLHALTEEAKLALNQELSHEEDGRPRIDVVPDPYAEGKAGVVTPVPPAAPPPPMT